MSTELLIQLAVLAAFVLLMLVVNRAAGGARHWSSAILKVVSYWMLLAGLALLIWKTAGAVL